MYFIGSFTTADNIIIKDPYAGRVLSEYIDLSEANTKPHEVKCKKGTWYAYHFYGNYSHPIALILMTERYHFTKDNHMVTTGNLFLSGSIVSSFGHMITAVDKQIIDNTMYTYIEPTEDMLYRIKDIKQWLHTSDVAEEKEIRKLLTTLEKKGEKFVKYSQLQSIYKTKRIPLESDLWAHDCHFRLQDNPVRATPIMGGVVTKTYSPVNKIYVDEDSSKECNVIYIDLDENTSKALEMQIIH